MPADPPAARPVDAGGQDRGRQMDVSLRHAGGWSGVVCSPTTLLKLYLVSHGSSGLSGVHKEVSLVYFSTFEPIELTPDSIMQQAGVTMLYDSASNPRLPCLYICPVANVLGRAPLIPCFIGGSHTASRTIHVLEAPPPTRSGTGATAAGSTRSTSGCGATVVLRQGPPPDGVLR